MIQNSKGNRKLIYLNCFKIYFSRELRSLSLSDDHKDKPSIASKSLPNEDLDIPSPKSLAKPIRKHKLGKSKLTETESQQSQLTQEEIAAIPMKEVKATFELKFKSVDPFKVSFNF